MISGGGEAEEKSERERERERERGRQVSSSGGAHGAFHKIPLLPFIPLPRRSIPVDVDWSL
jgi:hypothetical protein